MCTMEVPVTIPIEHTVDGKGNHPNWRKVDINHIINYQLRLHAELENIAICTLANMQDIEIFNTSINRAIKTASSSYLPEQRFNPNLKPYWTTDVRNAHKNAREQRKFWILEGKPRGMQHNTTQIYESERCISRCSKYSI